jgi:hypothetical protein
VISSVVPQEILHQLNVTRLSQVQPLHGHRGARYDAIEKIDTTSATRFIDRFPVEESLSPTAPPPRVSSTVEHSITVDNSTCQPTEVLLTQFIGPDRRKLEVAKSTYTYTVIDGLPVRQTSTVYCSNQKELTPCIWLILGTDVKLNKNVQIPPVPEMRTVVDERKPVKDR